MLLELYSNYTPQWVPKICIGKKETGDRYAETNVQRNSAKIMAIYNGYIYFLLKNPSV